VSNLAGEVLLRLAKAAVALLVGILVWVVLVGPVGVPGTPELALLCWLSGAAFVLLVESSPI
jgi:hypothetical protein